MKYREKREAVLLYKDSFRSSNDLSYRLFIYTIAHGIMSHIIEYPIQVKYKSNTYIYTHSISGNPLTGGFIIHHNIVSSK